ncbi:hypothetical protein COLO4_28722 [Corchorus olitorius]|uniref:Uncharacterized protein n=1 Tax=Corchorus olitorius TaxID=93759 RepID=A0A1R3HIK0_9ROSI|nr:hypothetical protein COLO4_28722 [Corchorus olitorius]
MPRQNIGESTVLEMVVGVTSCGGLRGKMPQTEGGVGGRTQVGKR